MDKSLFKNGIRFKCEGSANCCVSRGSHGFVFLSKKDLTRLAKFFKISLINFKKSYCEATNKFLHLKEIKKNGECIFLKNKKCSVYKARPIQCRTWPFWPENMNSKTWNRDIINFCPGIGKGAIISKKIIDRLLKIDEINAEEIYKEEH